MKVKPIYLDYNASTPTDPLVAAAMQPYLSSCFGNPSGTHAESQAASEAVGNARANVAAFLECEADEVVFTSGATEANNTALWGVADALRAQGDHIITTAVEHPSVLNPCRALAERGFLLTVVPVDSTGCVAADDVLRAVTNKTILVSVMHANNEVGTLQPVSDIAQGLRGRGVLLHCDAALSAGKIETTVPRLGVDLLADRC